VAAADIPSLRRRRIPVSWRERQSQRRVAARMANRSIRRTRTIGSKVAFFNATDFQLIAQKRRLVAYVASK
jgi:hypothetical protein